MSDDRNHFEQFMKRRETAARAYVNGDSQPLDALSAKSGAATFFGPRGGHTNGAEQVWSRYESDAKAFQKGGETHFEILHLQASDGLAYWVGFQHAQARMQGREQAIPMKLRVTELFRREGDDWKLIHRHADDKAEPA